MEVILMLATPVLVLLLGIAVTLIAGPGDRDAEMTLFDQIFAALCVIIFMVLQAIMWVQLGQRFGGAM